MYFNEYKKKKNRSLTPVCDREPRRIPIAFWLRLLASRVNRPPEPWWTMFFQGRSCSLFNLSPLFVLELINAINQFCVARYLMLTSITSTARNVHFAYNAPNGRPSVAVSAIGKNAIAATERKVLGAFDKVCPSANGNQLDVVLATTFQKTQGEIFRFCICFCKRICL